MATLHMVCGMAGAGKSTLARQLEQELPAFRLTADEWLSRIVDDGTDEVRRAVVEAIQWEIAVRMLELGVDVILESGFWSRGEREEFRARAKSLGAGSKLYFLDVPRDELLRRLERRNADLPPHTFRVEATSLDEWLALFEPPTPDELPDRSP